MSEAFDHSKIEERLVPRYPKEPVVARAVMKPVVWQPRNPEMVEYRTPIHHNPDEFFETQLTPEEARRFAIDLLNDAERAEQRRGANARLRKRRSAAI